MHMSGNSNTNTVDNDYVSPVWNRFGITITLGIVVADVVKYKNTKKYKYSNMLQ